MMLFYALSTGKQIPVMWRMTVHLNLQ